jgi:catalase (peroxidase I)
MGFHDAGSWDENSSDGGADGSLLMDFGEHERPENNGLQKTRTLLRSVQEKYKVGYADLVQYAHNHATISCPKGPRVRTFIGRKDATKANPTGLLPDTHDDPDNLIALFKRKGLSERDLAALVGAHATAHQRFVDTSPAAVNKPLDTTPGVWDVEFYNDTLNNPSGSTADQKVFVLPSDKALSQHPKTSGDWHRFVGNQGGWNADYSRAYIKVSLFGVKQEQLDKLVDCTQTLPASRDSFP